MPGQLLRIERAHDSNARGGELIYSSLEEISLAGASGEIKLRDRELLKAFAARTERLYILAYR
jgi:hypothetical protein